MLFDTWTAVHLLSALWTKFRFCASHQVNLQSSTNMEAVFCSHGGMVTDHPRKLVTNLNTANLLTREQTASKLKEEEHWWSPCLSLQPELCEKEIKADLVIVYHTPGPYSNFLSEFLSSLVL